MVAKKRGLWLVGARGGVAATVAVGLAELARAGSEAATVGLVTESPLLAGPDFPSWNQEAPWSSWVLGGHEVRAGTLLEAARELERQNGALPVGLADRHATTLDAIDRRIRPGVRFRSGTAIDALTPGSPTSSATPRALVEQIKADLIAFRESNQLDQVVVAILSSTEPPTPADTLPTTWDQLNPLLDRAESCPLRASSLYALAAIESGMPLINFTPSLGASCAALEERAVACGTPLAGRDGKTGETLLKSVLAPMFAKRALRVESWVGHNLLGNRDGAVLADPDNKRSKIDSKDALLARLLGYAPQSLVSIEPIASLGDWKTAWDHVHFRGFLGVPMTLQFTWQGCDSALAAPLVLDLARLITLAEERGEAGPINALAAFFKSPQGAVSDDFGVQFERLRAWVSGLERSSVP
ncbi:inositol-3-phosphate synthase [Botrimarina hoheduenensis]|uniref:Inositol-3-phosphate synthase n=1 Tax=Botrimarina hoheduenensis TaxID=2528000 RepID=A0A5C5W6W6_9BACT|nr:inositol-3-phosphate synthase [Botrimarina hoheduenensis]TWT46430.1 Inositol-3-phosphate synthase [Botrimarina hoheduenensis]